MAKLYFNYGAMGSSKTAQALMTKYNYEEKGYRVVLIKPSIDNRDNLTDTVKSRIGLTSKCLTISKNYNLEDLIIGDLADIIIVEEAQFCTKKQIQQLRKIASYYNKPVVCYGLKTDYKCELFEGSKALFELADNINEIKSVCSCGNKAIVNARFDANKKIITKGNKIDIGGNEKYIGMCWKCWKDKVNYPSLKRWASIK